MTAHQPAPVIEVTRRVRHAAGTRIEPGWAVPCRQGDYQTPGQETADAARAVFAADHAAFTCRPAGATTGATR